MNVKLREATQADLALVKNLVPYYIYDMSEHMGWPCTPDGRFDGCDTLSTYWSDSDKHAFVLRSGKELVGFALVRAEHKDGEIHYYIAEFFVLRKFRGRGVGEAIARQLFDRFRGRWMVEHLAKNKPAAEFWRKVVARYASKGKGFKQRVGVSGWGKTNALLFRNDISTASGRRLQKRKNSVSAELR